MPDFIGDILQKARSLKKRIILPEGTEPRVLAAAREIAADRIADLVLLGDGAEIRSALDRMGVDSAGFDIVNPETSGRAETYASTLYELRKHKGVTRQDAARMARDPLYFGTMMLKSGEADGMVAGAARFTADIIRPALQIIKTVPGVKTASAMFFIVKDGHPYLFADCGLNRNPNPEQLADITFSTALTARFFGIAPRIALLSYSTRGSGKGEEVVKMAAATRLAREKLEANYRGEFVIDGELQFDAAFDPGIAEIKCPGSPLRGRTNVFIFPDLGAGNIAYKLAHRMAGANAYGPILQGISPPINDLSRGCSSRDITVTVAITAIQAQRHNSKY
ncbi:MAG: phosphate acetyltransferase [PVC group bacterium]